MGKLIRTVLLVINLPIYYFVFLKMFQTKEALVEALKYYFQPDMVSTIKGDMLKDMKESHKIGTCLLICLVIFVVEDIIMSKIIIGLGFVY